MEVQGGDKLVVSAGETKKTWIVSAINNNVVKYFDEANRYQQMPVVHLAEMIKNHQVEIVRQSESLFLNDDML
ncbi:MAG: hypothetical protein H6Q66_575 [Firmicutes bacterium]|nr:hypothetical protein [Bacillota bacterium]